MSIKKDEPVLGKKWAGEKFPTVKSAADVVASQELQKEYVHENAVPLSVYFTKRRINDPVKQAMMFAFTKVRKATIEAFDEIFETF
jgi:hypothetical protein